MQCFTFWYGMYQFQNFLFHRENRFDWTVRLWYLVLGRDRLPSVEDKSKLQYCEAAMLEGMRVAPAVPLNIRSPTNDAQLGKDNEYLANILHYSSAFLPIRISEP